MRQRTDSSHQTLNARILLPEPFNREKPQRIIGEACESRDVKSIELGEKIGGGGRDSPLSTNISRLVLHAEGER